MCFVSSLCFGTILCYSYCSADIVRSWCRDLGTECCGRRSQNRCVFINNATGLFRERDRRRLKISGQLIEVSFPRSPRSCSLHNSPTKSAAGRPAPCGDKQKEYGKSEVRRRRCIAEVVLIIVVVDDDIGNNNDAVPITIPTLRE